ncbi:hypothetical protein BD413DRAFT_260640 [Trametes elegans]|nr:hypothetical protein BD413DRAFT_260640 [Trametes elegans]
MTSPAPSQLLRTPQNRAPSFISPSSEPPRAPLQVRTHRTASRALFERPNLVCVRPIDHACPPGLGNAPRSSTVRVRVLDRSRPDLTCGSPVPARMLCTALHSCSRSQHRSTPGRTGLPASRPPRFQLGFALGSYRPSCPPYSFEGGGVGGGRSQPRKFALVMGRPAHRTQRMVAPRRPG